ncbi:hypothetical protein [Dyella sp. ASV21]|uniref:hypothetical protein n=1 Tax=Dyella sp. ASV21 TaxID=2795114 RepID=UPI0018EC5D21|nr:hypothetical protein [Dyella sp. ASV21]
MRRPWEWLLPLALLAAPLLAQEVPPALKDWQGWVLHDVPEHACPWLRTDGDRACVWPGRLSIEAGKDGAHFSFEVHVDAADWVALPGNGDVWPQQVVVNGKPLPVLQHDNGPALRLEPGDYTLRGELPWVSRPARLHVPTSIGLVTLNLDGTAVSRIERNGEQLTLGEAAAAQRAADALSVRVYRRLTDGLPATLETQLQFNVTGSAREQVLGPVLPPGFVATALAGELPARLESDGRLRVQLRPGQWKVSLGARSTGVLEKVALMPPGEPWPAQEVWSYADAGALRSTRVEGQATDAAQADVPAEWQSLPAYALDGAHGLSIESGTRGGEGGQGDQLTLQRKLWLDFDGHGFTALDHLTGTLRRSQRLDVSAPWQLQSATQDATPLLVTADGAGRQGVELRGTKIDVSAGLRLPERGHAPSGGWQLALERIDGTLYLPNGYRLLGAIGADRSPDSWVAQWSLLDLFVVALIALLAGRLLGWPWALVALGFLALSLHEGGAPRWTLAVVLALGLLTRALPEGRLRVFSRIGALALLVLAALWTLPFAATQMNYALHPQLEQGAYMGRVGFEPDNEAPSVAMDEETEVAPAVEEASVNAPPAPPAPATGIAAAQRTRKERQSYAPSVNGKVASLASAVVTGSRITAANTVGQEVDAHSVIQAGRGTPSWNVGNNYRLGWSGPVTAEQSTRLVIAPAWLVRLLRVGMLALLVALLGKLALGAWRAWPGSAGGWRLRAGAVALLALSLLSPGAHAQATPGNEVLNALRERLTEAPKCEPDCTSTAQATVQAHGDQLSLELELHAGAAAAVSLPQGDDALQLQTVDVDGKPADLLRSDIGALMVRMERGVHRVTLRYRVAPVDTANVQFPSHPQRVLFSGTEWSADGVDEGRLLGDNLTLNRLRTAADGQARVGATQTFPPFVRVVRTLQLGNEWNVRNTVQRIAPVEGGFSLDLPLLPGEHPLGDNARVKDGRIGVTFNAGINEVSWTSRLDRGEQLALTAPALGERAEQWVVQAAPIWHVDAKGMPGTLSDDGLLYQPLPGETLALSITQPKALVGPSLAFDAVSVQSQAGDRSSEAQVTLVARSTRGGEHALGLPPGAELLEARRDERPINLAIRDGKIGLPLLPGVHRYALRLRLPQGIGAFTHTPTLTLNAPAANLTLHQALPQDRWVLWTWGPSMGPAVLYWSQLLVLLLAAWLLARYAPTPLRFYQWLLLGLGFSAFAWGAYALVVVWLILLGLRARHVLPERYGTTFNLQQAALALLTLVALAVLISAVPKGLLGLPDMHVAGNGSTAWRLNWFADQTDGALPVAGVFSVSLWVYKIAMLLWALWLANALIGWLRWGFQSWSEGGYWRARQRKTKVPPPVPEATE